MLLARGFGPEEFHRMQPCLEAVLAGWVATRSDLIPDPVRIRLRIGFEDRLPHLEGSARPSGAKEDLPLPSELLEALV
jgi:hypothetical protein